MKGKRKALGEEAHEAYVRAKGDPAVFPEWRRLPAGERAAWQAAAEEVSRITRDRVKREAKKAARRREGEGGAGAGPADD